MRLDQHCCFHNNKKLTLLRPGSSWLAGHKIALLRERLLGGKRNAGKGVYRTMKQLFDAFDLDRRLLLLACKLSRLALQLMPCTAAATFPSMS